MQSPVRDAAPSQMLNPMLRPQPSRTSGPSAPSGPSELQQIFERLARPLTPPRAA